MSNLAVDKDLTKPAARLAHAAPREWAEFLEAFKKFTDVRRDQLVAASPEALQRVQGKAQQCVALEAILRDAIAGANQKL